MSVTALLPFSSPVNGRAYDANNVRGNDNVLGAQINAVNARFVVYTPTLTPAAVAAGAVAEQLFAVTGLTTADVVVVNPPAIANATGLAGVRVSAVNQIGIRFVNPTAGALVPAAGVYTILAVRS